MYILINNYYKVYKGINFFSRFFHVLVFSIQYTFFPCVFSLDFFLLLRRSMISKSFCMLNGSIPSKVRRRSCPGPLPPPPRTRRLAAFDTRCGRPAGHVRFWSIPWAWESERLPSATGYGQRFAHDLRHFGERNSNEKEVMRVIGKNTTYFR